MTVSPNFLSQSLYFRGYSEKLVQLCNALSIDASHIFHEDSDRHYGELAQHINTATVYKILGDFHFSIELEIWGMSQSKFTQILTDFAEVSIALEQKSVNLNHSTLPEIKDFNALSDAVCCRLNRFRFSHSEREIRKTVRIHRLS